MMTTNDLRSDTTGSETAGRHADFQHQSRAHNERQARHHQRDAGRGPTVAAPGQRPIAVAMSLLFGWAMLTSTHQVELT